MEAVLAAAVLLAAACRQQLRERQPQEQLPSDAQAITTGAKQGDFLSNALLEVHRAIAEGFSSLRMGEGFVFVQAKHLFSFDWQGDAETL